jgi:hypothetical protein
MPLLCIEGGREMVHLVLTAGSSWDIKMAVVGGQRVVCTFVIDMGDVDFQALFVLGATMQADVYKLSATVPPEELEPTVRCRHASFQFTAERTGVILLRFINEHSWTRPKSLRLSVEAMPSEPTETATVSPTAEGADAVGEAAAAAAAATAGNDGSGSGDVAAGASAALTTKLASWLATIPIGSPGAEGATSQRGYDAKPLITFAMAEGLEDADADEIYRLWVEWQMEEAERRMVAQGIEPPIEADPELLALGEYCESLDDGALHSSRTCVWHFVLQPVLLMRPR